jgi:hypothetical protein
MAPPSARRSPSPLRRILLISSCLLILPATAHLAAARGKDTTRANLPTSSIVGLPPLPAPKIVERNVEGRQRAALKQRAIARRSNLRLDPRKLLRLHDDEPVPIAATTNVDTISSKGSVALDTAKGTVTVRTELTLRANKTISRLYIYLGNFKSDHTSKASDNQGVLSSFPAGQGVLDVSLRTNLATGDTLVLIIEQSGTPECQSSFHQIVTCRVGSGNSFDIGTAWQALPYDVNAQQLVYPQTATLDLVVPTGGTAIATGVSDGVTQNGDGTQTFSFVNDIKGSFSFSISNAYSKASVPFAGGHEVHSYLFSPTAKQLGSAWRTRTAEIMAFHGARYGDYGPKVINVAEIPDGTGAAFGPMMTIFMPSQTLAVDPTHWSSSITLAHELAHQWFAGHIDVEEPISPWLSEGFATFAEMEYTAEQATKEYGFDYRPYYRQGANLSYIYTVPPTQDQPISSQQIVQAPSTIYFTVTYTKGALLVHQLRYLLGGDTPFFAAMKAYRQDHAKKGATVATLIDSLSRASGKQLDDYAKNWVFRAGYPIYQVALTRGQDAKSGTYQATIDVTADRDFGMPLEVELVTADGKTEKLTLPYAGKPAYTLSVERDSEIISIRFDPNSQLVGRFRGEIAGDVHINGAVDGIDVIYTAMVQGERFQPQFGGLQLFPFWGDLHTDATIDDKDLDIVLGAFGTQQRKAGGQ